MSLIEKQSESVLASASSIAPKSTQIRVTGTTNIATIVPPYQGFSGMLVVIPVDGTVNTVTTGNIQTAVAMAQNRATVLFYNKTLDKWIAGAIGGAT